MDGVTAGHAIGGAVLLSLGVAATLAPKRRQRSPHRRIGQSYLVLLVGVLTSGMVIGARHPGLSLFEVATPPTLLLGLTGFAAARGPLRRRLGGAWKAWHIAGMGGSLIGVVTATGFQVVPRLAGTHPVTMTLLWVAPTVVGSVLIRRATARHLRRAHAPAVASR